MQSHLNDRVVILAEILTEMEDQLVEFSKLLITQPEIGKELFEVLKKINTNHLHVPETKTVLQNEKIQRLDDNWNIVRVFLYKTDVNEFARLQRLEIKTQFLSSFSVIPLSLDDYLDLPKTLNQELYNNLDQLESFKPQEDKLVDEGIFRVNISGKKLQGMLQSKGIIISDDKLNPLQYAGFRFQFGNPFHYTNRQAYPKRAISFFALQVMSEFLDTDDESISRVARAIEWLTQLGIATHERLDILHKYHLGIDLCNFYNFDPLDIPFERMQLFATFVFEKLLPHIIERHNQLQLELYTIPVEEQMAVANDMIKQLCELSKILTCHNQKNRFAIALAEVLAEINSFRLTVAYKKDYKKNKKKPLIDKLQFDSNKNLAIKNGEQFFSEEEDNTIISQSEIKHKRQEFLKEYHLKEIKDASVELQGTEPINGLKENWQIIFKYGNEKNQALLDKLKIFECANILLKLHLFETKYTDQLITHTPQDVTVIYTGLLELLQKVNNDVNYNQHLKGDVDSLFSYLRFFKIIESTSPKPIKPALSKFEFEYKNESKKFLSLNKSATNVYSYNVTATPITENDRDIGYRFSIEDYFTKELLFAFDELSENGLQDCECILINPDVAILKIKTNLSDDINFYEIKTGNCFHSVEITLYENYWAMNGRIPQHGPYKVLDESRFAYQCESGIVIYNFINRTEQLIQTSNAKISNIKGELGKRLLVKRPNGFIVLPNDAAQKNIVVYDESMGDVLKIDDNNWLYVKNVKSGMPHSSNHDFTWSGSIIRKIRFDEQTQQFSKLQQWTVGHSPKKLLLTQDNILLYQDLTQIYALDLEKADTQPKMLWMHPESSSNFPLFKFDVVNQQLYIVQENNEYSDFPEALHLFQYDLTNLRDFLNETDTSDLNLQLTTDHPEITCTSTEDNTPLGLWLKRKALVSDMEKLFLELIQLRETHPKQELFQLRLQQVLKRIRTDSLTKEAKERESYRSQARSEQKTESSDLLHFDKILQLQKLWHETQLILEEEHTNEVTRILRFECVMQLACLNYFSLQSIQQLFAVPLQVIPKFTKGLKKLSADPMAYVLGINYRCEIADIELLFSSPEKADLLAKGIKWLYWHKMLNETNRQKLLVLSVEQLHLLSGIKNYLAKTFGSKEESQAIDAAFFNNLANNSFQETYFIRSFEDYTPLFSVMINPELLKEVLELYQRLENIYKQANETKIRKESHLHHSLDIAFYHGEAFPNKSTQYAELEKLTEAKEATYQELTIELFFQLIEVICCITNPRSASFGKMVYLVGGTRATESESKHAEEINNELFAIKKAAQDSQYAIKFFGAKCAAFFKKLWLENNLTIENVFIATLTDPQHYTKLIDLIKNENRYINILHLAWHCKPSFTITHAMATTLQPLYASCDVETLQNVWKALDWLVILDIATPETFEFVKRHPDAIRFLSNMILEAKNANHQQMHQLGKYVFNTLKPFIEAKQIILNAEKTLPKPKVIDPIIPLNESKPLKNLRTLQHIPDCYADYEAIYEYDEIVKTRINVHSADIMNSIVIEKAYHLNPNFLLITPTYLIYKNLRKESEEIQIWNVKTNKLLHEINHARDYDFAYSILDNDRFAYVTKGVIFIFDLNKEMISSFYKLNEKDLHDISIIGEIDNRLVINTDKAIKLLPAHLEEKEIVLNAEDKFKEVKKLNSDMLVCAGKEKFLINVKPLTFFSNSKADIETCIQTFKLNKNNMQFEPVDTWTVPTNVDNLRVLDTILLFRDEKDICALNLADPQSKPKSIWTHPGIHISSFSFEVIKNQIQINLSASYVHHEKCKYNYVSYDLDDLPSFTATNTLRIA